MALAHSPRIITSGLVGCWDAGNTKSYPSSGTTWSDLSGSNNTGTLQASPTYNSLGYFTFNSASSQYVSTTTSYVAAGDATVSVIFRTTSITGTKMIGFDSFQTGAPGPGSGSYVRNMYVGTNGKLYYGDDNTKIITSSGTVIDNTWRYVVASSSLTTGTTLYVNGISIGTAAASTGLGGFTGWWKIAGGQMGGWTNANVGYFNGDIAYVSLYNRALSAAEVTQNFNALRGRFGI